MNIRLNAHSTSFATRERAAELVRTLQPDGVEVELDLDGIMASPSFLAQLLGDLSARASFITVVGADAHHAALVTKLIRQLGLGGSVRLAELAQ